jgi:hypothetical protein
MKITREWVMPNGDTLEMEPVRRLVQSYIQPNMITVDPFARNCKFATWRNDLSPDTSAEYHLEVLDFLRMLNDKKVSADLVIWDPPYSSRQMSELYQSVGLNFGIRGGQRVGRWRDERNLLNHIVRVGGIIISFGWNSIGMGVERFYEPLEILLLCHGGAHNDTIIVVEKKLVHQESLFAPTEFNGSGAYMPTTAQGMPAAKEDMQS